MATNRFSSLHFHSCIFFSRFRKNSLLHLISREFPTWQGGGVSWAPSVARLVR